MALKLKIVHFGGISLKPRFTYRYTELRAALDRILVHKDCCALFLLFVIFVGLTLWSWRKWPDILIDFGHELYIPWQLASGKVLYRDIAFFNGPLSQYFNALIFYVFGTSFINLVYSNLIIAALLTFVIYLFFKKACDQYTAVFSSLVFLTIFGFAHFTGIGNYNWICPYSHELTHGIFLSCLMLLTFQRCFLGLHLGLLALAGICLGFILLTKMEVGLAAFASAILGNAVIMWAQKPQFRQGLAIISIFFVAVLIPIVGCLVFFRDYMPLKEVFYHLSTGWRAIFETHVTQSKFYLESIGRNSILRNLVFMTTGVLSIVLFVIAAIMIDVREASSVKKRTLLLILPTVSMVAAFTIKFLPWLIFRGYLSPMIALRTALHAGNASWLIVGWALPPIILIFGASLAWPFIKRPGDSKITAKFAALLIWAVFSFILLAKILLHTRLYQYGFALAMPATLLMVSGFVWLMSNGVKRLGGNGVTFRRIMAGALLLDIFVALIFSYKIYSLKYFNVGRGRDRIITYQTRLSLSPAGPSVAELLKQIEYLVPEKGKFVALPEGIMLNYLSRRSSPTRYTGFTPPEMIIYGEEDVFKSLSDTKPDFIIITPRDMSEYGVGFLGEDLNYGRNIVDWIFEKYEKVWQEPDYLEANDKLKISILKRKNMDKQ